MAKVYKPGEYFFTVNQRNKRFDDAFDYSPVRITVAEKLGSNNYRYVSGCNQFGDRENWCKANLTPG